jgi:drug/metabolite transporter (DMT)-like permease
VKAGGLADRMKLVAAAMLFSTGGAAIKAVSLGAWQVAAFRSGVAALGVLALSSLARDRKGYTWRAALVGVAYAATLVLFVAANKLTTSADTIFLQSTAPLYMLFLGPLLLHERVRRRDLGFMAVVALGLVIFFLGTDQPLRTAPDPTRGNLLAALSGVTWALTVCGLRWMGTRESTGRGSATAAVVLGNIFAFLAGAPFAFPASGTAGDWLIIAYLGVFQIALAYVLVTAALRVVPALEAAVLLLVEPALNPIWSWLVHGERPTAWALAGGALIIGSTTLKSWLDARPPAGVVAAWE